jgi:hypothetical protein
MFWEKNEMTPGRTRKGYISMCIARVLFVLTLPELHVLPEKQSACKS